MSREERVGQAMEQLVANTPLDGSEESMRESNQIEATATIATELAALNDTLNAILNTLNREL